MGRYPFPVAVLAALLVVSAACGDSGEPATTTVPSPPSTTLPSTTIGTATTQPATTTTPTTVPPVTTVAAPSTTTVVPTTTVAATSTPGAPVDPPPAVDASLEVDGQAFDVVYTCSGLPLVGLFSNNALVLEPEPVLLEIWGEETGEVGYLLQYGPGGETFEGFSDGTQPNEFEEGTALLTSDSGAERQIAYRVPTSEECGYAAELEDPTDPASGIRYDVVDVCDFGGGRHVAWLNEGGLVELELAGTDGGTFQAVLRDVLIDIEDRTQPAEPGTWQRAADGTLSGTGRLYESGATDADPLHLDFSFGSRVIRRCS